MKTHSMELKISLIVSVIVIVDSLSNDTDEYSLSIADKGKFHTFVFGH